MDYHQLLIRYFGTDDVADLAPEELDRGVDQLRLQLGLENDRGRRFALWCLLFTMGAAPDLDVAFKDERDRDAARNFMDAMDRQSELAS